MEPENLTILEDMALDSEWRQVDGSFDATKAHEDTKRIYTYMAVAAGARPADRLTDLARCADVVWRRSATAKPAASYGQHSAVGGTCPCQR